MPDIIQAHSFIEGHDYSRREDIHAVYGGNAQSGISTTTGPYIFLFTGGAGKAHGYADSWDGEIFKYFGEGQVGDMQMTRGNLAIRDHMRNGNSLLLFQSLGKGRPVRFIGEFACSATETRVTPDGAGNPRQAIIFLLRKVGVESDDVILEETFKSSLLDLRLKAYTPITETEPKRLIVQVRQRRGDVKAYALKRAGGKCECCGVEAPFLNKHGIPFLEVHHIQKLSDYGLDRPDNVAAITPNCHRRIHQSIEGPEIDARLAEAIKEKELACSTNLYQPDRLVH